MNTPISYLCVVCLEWKEQDQMNKHRLNRCKKCHAKRNWMYMQKKTQLRLEKIYKSNNPAVSFCECGDYFYNTRSYNMKVKRYDKCSHCRRGFRPY